jgi:hypothetical protein
MIARELRVITESPKIKNGVLNPNELGDQERELLEKFLEYKVRPQCCPVFPTFSCVLPIGFSMLFFFFFRVADCTSPAILEFLARNLSRTIAPARIGSQ